MYKRYMFKTSLGEVVVQLDPDQFKIEHWDCHDEEGRTAKILSPLLNRRFDIVSGADCIKNLYDGSLEYIFKTDQGDLCARIELSDGYYGAPEYLLTEIE